MNDEEGNNLDDLTSLEKYEEKKYGAKKSYDLMYRSSWIKIDENPEKTLRFADDNVTTSYFDKFKIFGGVLDFQWRLVWDQPKWRGANCTMSGYQGIYIRNANSEEEYHGIPIYIWPYALDKVVSRFATPVNLNNPIEFAYEYGIDLIMHLLEQEGNIFDQTTANAVLFIGGHQILINKEIMFMHSSHFKQIFEEHSYNDTLNLNYTNITYHDFVNFYQMIHPKTFSLRGRDITGVMHVESILRTPSVRRHINYYFRTKNQIKCQDAVNYFVCYADTLCTAKYPSIIATMTVPTPFEKFQNQYDRLVGPPDDNIVHAMDCEFGGELMYESDCPAAHFEVDIYWSFIEDSGWECYRLEVVIALVHGSLEDYKGDKRLNPVRLNDYGSLIDCEKAVDEEKKRNPELLSFIHFTSEAPLEIRLNSYSLQEYNDLCWDFPLAEYTVPGVPWLYTYKFCLEPNGQLITKKQYETTCARKENTDTTLVVQGKHIHVNKQFLAYHSTYFANLFAQHKDIPYFDLNVNYKDMVMFLGSFASEVMVPMTSQMATLLHMAESFGVPKVKHLVEHWLDNNPFISTSDLADIAIRYNLKSLMKRVHFECAKERMDLERKKKYNLLWFWFKQRIPFMESERWLRKYESGEALRDTSANDFCFKSGWREIRQRTEEHILKIRINGLKSKWILCQLIDDCLALQFDFDWQQVKDSEKIIAFDGIIRVWVRDADLNIVEYIYQLENVENTLIHTAKDTQSLFICNKEIGEHLTSPTKCRFEYSLVPVFDRSENYEKLFQQSLTANCTLKVEGRFVHVNKEFLSYHSTVFATLLAGTRNKIPEIKDVTYEQFGMLYSIINLELFVLPDRNAKELLELAKKFKMVTVTRHVEHHLLNNAKLVPMKLDQLQNEYGINKTRNRGIAHRMEIAKNIKHSKNQNVFNQLDKFIENGLTCEFNARLTRNEDNSNVRFVLKFKWSELKALESFSLTLLVVLDNGPLEDTNCQPKKPKMERNANPILRSNYKSLQECMHACAMARQANPEQFTYIHFTSEAPLNFKYKIDLKENQRSVTINQRISQLDYPKLPWNCRYDLQIEPRFVAEHVFSESKQHNRILVVEEKELHVNKEFLECHSEFFNVLFNTTMLEGRQKKIKLGGVSYNDFAMFLSSIHPDIVFPTDDRIQTIMTVANQFLCPKVMRLAVDHLTNNSELCLFDKLTLALQFPSSTLMEKTIDKLNLEDRKTLEEKGDFETLWKWAKAKEHDKSSIKFY